MTLRHLVFQVSSSGTAHSASGGINKMKTETFAGLKANCN